MQAKTTKNPGQKKTAARIVRNPKSQEEIKKELREQRAMDPGKSAVEDYLTPNSKHFGL